jgi:hypothetical protein
MARMRMDRTRENFPNSLESRSMVLRLVLVSIVASLGVTPPAEGEVAGWSRAVQTWLDARLAGWSEAEPVLESAGVPSGGALGADFDVAALELELELMAAFAAPPAAAVVTAAPVEDERSGEDGDFLAVVEEMVADFTQVEIEETTITPADQEPAPVVPPVAVADEAEVWSREAEIIEDELAVVAPSAIVAAPPMAVLPAGEDEMLGDALDFLLVETAEARLRAQTSTAPAPVEDADQTCPTVAPPAAGAGNPLRDAVRLTRDAVYAWLNLLQSSALVTVPE